MQEFLNRLQDRLAPAEEIFFAWLIRVFAAATLVGTAWIDDAPPLELGAMIIALYVVARVITQAGAFFVAAPFSNRLLKGGFVVVCLALLGLAFLTVAVFTERLALAAVG